MKIISSKSKTKKIREFNKHEWKLIHPEHFGDQQDDKYWTKKKLFFKAVDKQEIVGTLNGDFRAGVMYISQLIISHDKRGLGIGNELMHEAERIAKKNKLHLIYLKTGVGWKAVKFYKSLGFNPEAKIKHFYSNKDFWIMTKEI